MSHIVPFKAVCPPAHMAHLVASRSYVSYSPLSLKRKLAENPFTFIHIINPEFGKPITTKPSTVERFMKVKEKYEEFKGENILIEDNAPAFYLYHQITPEKAFTGLICGVSVDDYLQGKIKIHEHTLTQREETFCTYLDTCNFNAEPVLLTYRENVAELQALLHAAMLQRPDYDFTTTDRHRHQMWRISESSTIKHIQHSFGRIPHLYIADGHHRMASSALLAAKRQKLQGIHDGGMFNYALALIMPAELLEIKAFHRLLTLDKPTDETSLLSALDVHFTVKRAANAVIPEVKRLWGMRLSSGWYSLKLKKPLVSKSKADRLDAVILTRTILEPLFGILDQKTDKRIQFIPGHEDLLPYEQQIGKGTHSALFTLCRVDADELFAVADAGEVMPPKSTWIAPKLRSGLTIMSLV